MLSVRGSKLAKEALARNRLGDSIKSLRLFWEDGKNTTSNTEGANSWKEALETFMFGAGKRRTAGVARTEGAGADHAASDAAKFSASKLKPLPRNAVTSKTTTTTTMPATTMTTNKTTTTTPTTTTAPTAPRPVRVAGRLAGRRIEETDAGKIAKANQMTSTVEENFWAIGRPHQVRLPPDNNHSSNNSHFPHHHHHHHNVSSNNSIVTLYRPTGKNCGHQHQQSQDGNSSANNSSGALPRPTWERAPQGCGVAGAKRAGSTLESSRYLPAITQNVNGNPPVPLQSNHPHQHHPHKHQHHHHLHHPQHQPHQRHPRSASQFVFNAVPTGPSGALKPRKRFHIEPEELVRRNKVRRQGSTQQEAAPPRTLKPIDRAALLMSRPSPEMESVTAASPAAATEAAATAASTRNSVVSQTLLRSVDAARRLEARRVAAEEAKITTTKSRGAATAAAEEREKQREAAAESVAAARADERDDAEDMDPLVDEHAALSSCVQKVTHEARLSETLAAADDRMCQTLDRISAEMELFLSRASAEDVDATSKMASKGEPEEAKSVTDAEDDLNELEAFAKDEEMIDVETPPLSPSLSPPNPPPMTPQIERHSLASTGVILVERDRPTSLKEALIAADAAPTVAAAADAAPLSTFSNRREEAVEAAPGQKLFEEEEEEEDDMEDDGAVNRGEGNREIGAIKELTFSEVDLDRAKMPPPPPPPPQPLKPPQPVTATSPRSRSTRREKMETKEKPKRQPTPTPTPRTQQQQQQATPERAAPRVPLFQRFVLASSSSPSPTPGNAESDVARGASRNVISAALREDVSSSSGVAGEKREVATKKRIRDDDAAEVARPKVVVKSRDRDVAVARRSDRVVGVLRFEETQPWGAWRREEAPAPRETVAPGVAPTKGEFLVNAYGQRLPMDGTGSVEGATIKTTTATTTTERAIGTPMTGKRKNEKEEFWINAYGQRIPVEKTTSTPTTTTTTTTSEDARASASGWNQVDNDRVPPPPTQQPAQTQESTLQHVWLLKTQPSLSPPSSGIDENSNLWRAFYREVRANVGRKPKMTTMATPDAFNCNANAASSAAFSPASRPAPEMDENANLWRLMLQNVIGQGGQVGQVGTGMGRSNNNNNNSHSNCVKFDGKDYQPLAMQSGMQADLQSVMQAGMQAGMQVGMQAGMQQRARMQAVMQTGTTTTTTTTGENLWKVMAKNLVSREDKRK